MKNYAITFCLMILLLNYQIAHAQQNLAQQTYTIFEQHCLDCHGEFGSYTDVLTIKHKNLIEDKAVIPRQPDTSELYLRLLDDTDKGSQMPLGQEPLDAERQSPRSSAGLEQARQIGMPFLNLNAISSPPRRCSNPFTPM